APWLRGFYFTSATQEGNPIDRMLGAMGATFGMPAPEPVRRAHGERRSFFLRNMLTELIFPEAGLGTFDPRAEERRSWVFRGTLAGAALVTVLGSAVFLYSYLRNSGLIADQEAQFTQLNARLANVAVRQAPTDPLDLPLALDAATEVAAARSATDGGPLTLLGPSATPELAEAQRRAYDRVLANVLEPRMVALLEATMWRQIRDPTCSTR
ncbi:MAG: type VI secretion system membrane subunit TssM, partial [Rhodobacteraceae bacterium]|nr:type VI secretion system membrane subunit TssM [Paracoccaceae bacterium]